jgi:hypothetical protein
MRNNKQTPIEKAKELIDKFVLLDNDIFCSVNYPYSKQCALIAVDEILRNFGNLTDVKQHYCAYSTIQYYQEVKQEIENNEQQ